LCLYGGSTPSSAAPVRVAGIVFEETNKHAAPNAVVELMKARDGKSDSVAKTKADAAGKFAFAPQNVAANELLLVRTNWMGYTYVAPAYDPTGQLQQEMKVKIEPAKVRLLVYQSTDQIVPINFMTHHLAIESKAGGLKCIERIIVENPTAKTFLGLGKRRATVLLNLPATAKNVKLDEQISDGTLEKRPDGYAIMKPIPPSAYEPRSLIIINYDMDWPSSLPWQRKVNFSRKVQYPTKFFFVARTSDDKRLEVSASQLSKDQEAPLNINGQSETRVVNAIGRPMGGAPVLKAGDDLKIAVSSPVNPLFWGFFGFLILFCSAVPLALMRRSTPSDEMPLKSAEPPETGSVYARTLATDKATDGPIEFQAPARKIIEGIARLDEEFNRGVIAQREYSLQRSRMKNQVVEMLQSDALIDQPSESTQHN